MPAEWVVVILGLVVGYCLVSYLMSRGKATSAAARQPPPDPWQGSAWSESGQGARADPITPAWHEVLGVPESASREQMDQAYRLRMSQYHPDKVARLGEDIQRLAEQRAKEINAAYDEGMRRLSR